MECLFIQKPDPDCLLTFLGCERIFTSVPMQFFTLMQAVILLH